MHIVVYWLVQLTCWIHSSSIYSIYMIYSITCSYAENNIDSWESLMKCWCILLLTDFVNRGPLTLSSICLRYVYYYNLCETFQYLGPGLWYQNHHTIFRWFQYSETGKQNRWQKYLLSGTKAHPCGCVWVSGAKRFVPCKDNICMCYTFVNNYDIQGKDGRLCLDDMFVFLTSLFIHCSPTSFHSTCKKLRTGLQCFIYSVDAQYLRSGQRWYV
jgi:hypothetical protein